MTIIYSRKVKSFHLQKPDKTKYSHFSTLSSSFGAMISRYNYKNYHHHRHVQVNGRVKAITTIGRNFLYCCNNQPINLWIQLIIIDNFVQPNITDRTWLMLILHVFFSLSTFSSFFVEWSEHSIQKQRISIDRFIGYLLSSQFFVLSKKI